MSKNLINFPFNPKKSPFFYGWVVVAIGTIGIIASVPGQTMGVSLFTDSLINALNISRDQLSFTYMVGTIMSSFVLTRAGKWFDKNGARKMISIATIMLSLVLILFSTIDVLSNKIELYTADLSQGISQTLKLGMMVFLFFALRFSGQGMMTAFNRTMIMKWFDQRRGFATGLSSVMVSIGFSMAPFYFAFQINKTSWQDSYLILSAIVFSVAILGLIFNRDTPEACGLIPDGKEIKPLSDFKVDKKNRKQYTLKEARKTSAIWIISASVAFYAFFMSGFTFHLISIFNSVGMTADQAVHIFIPTTIISVIMSLVMSSISDYIKIKYLIMVYAIGAIVVSFSFMYLSDGFQYHLMIVGSGMIGGLYQVILNVALPRYFGRDHLGSINGFTMSIIVFCSSLSPLFFSALFSRTGSYKISGVLCLIGAIGIAVSSLFLKNPQHQIDKE